MTQIMLKLNAIVTHRPTLNLKINISPNTQLQVIPAAYYCFLRSAAVDVIL